MHHETLPSSQANVAFFFQANQEAETQKVREELALVSDLHLHYKYLLRNHFLFLFI